VLPEVIQSNLGLFVEGAKITLELTLISGICGLFFGLMLFLWADSCYVFVKWPAQFVVWVLRGTPLLVQIFFTYFALPKIVPFLVFDEFTAAAVALTFNVAAYNSEVFRSGFESVPRGQREAAKSLGLSKVLTFWIIIFPQALKVAIPALVNNIVALLKDSSLASGIGLLELSLAGQRVSSESFEPVPVLMTVALFYLSLTTLITICTNAFEKKFKTTYGVKKVTL
jgi:polar amino acid transport system permease protein